jgi:hypothetical protein
MLSQGQVLICNEETKRVDGAATQKSIVDLNYFLILKNGASRDLGYVKSCYP